MRCPMSTRLRVLQRAVVAAAAFFPSMVVAFALDPAPETGDCSLEGAVPAIVAAVEDDFSLLLDDGRRAALSGLEFPPAAPYSAELHAAARKRLSDWLVGRDVFVGAFSGGADRWGRMPARLFAPASAEKNSALVSVGAALLADGVARFRPDPLAAPCARDYVDAEAAARAKGEGVWASGRFAVIEATPENRPLLLQHRGMAIVAGKIRSVGKSSRAIYLNFDDKRLDGFAVVISRRNLAMFAESGLVPESLVGRRARVRGLIEAGLGPRIEISTPSEIEIIDGGQAR